MVVENLNDLGEVCSIIFLDARSDFSDLYIVVVTKKPPMCQIMRFSLYCINELIEGKRIALKNSNNTLPAMKSELHTEEFF